MRHKRRAAALAAAAVLVSPVLAHAATGPSADPAPARPGVQPWLAAHLPTLDDADVLRVAVRGTADGTARAAVEAAGMAVQQEWRLVDTVVAVGTAAQVEDLRDAEGVAYLEGDTPLSFDLQTAHRSTRGDEALALAQARGVTADGTGVSIAVIDSGIDGTHPMFTAADGSSTVVRNVKNACGAVIVSPSTTTRETCFQDVPTNDTDTISGGGHGTHVAGIAAGGAVTTASPAGTQLRGAATGAKLVGLSVGAAVGLLDAMSAQNWVLEHQRKPCAPAAEQELGDIDPACPPIRVTNHSYGPAASTGGNSFDESSTAVRLQRALLDKQVVAVWAAGNDGGDGSAAFTNPTGMDPEPGILMVASYDDGQTGSPDNALSSFSSRGERFQPLTYPDLAAPGDKITSACRATLVICRGAPSFDGGDYQTISGTSMAAPYVAGVVAQLFSAQPDLTPARVEEILENTAHEFTAGAAYEADPTNPASQTSFDKGHGLVDVLAALELALGLTPSEPAPATVVAARCAGTDLVVDPAGDTSAPGGSGAPAPAQDLLAVSFAADAANLTVTTRYTDLAQTPAPGSTSTTHTATWLGADGVRYGVSHVTPGGGFTAGRFDPGSNRLVAPTTAVPGTFTAGPDGTISWTVPLGVVGNPVIPVDQTLDPAAVPAVRDAYALTIAGIGALGTGLVFTAPVDRAPDGGAVPAWSVCNSEPTVEQPPAEEQPVEEECTRPNGKPCKGGKPDKDAPGKP